MFGGSNMAKRDTQLELYNEYFNELGIEFSNNISDFDEDDSDYIKIDPLMIGRVDSVLQNIPAVLLGLNQADAYKVVYNKGLGVLQKAANNPGFYRGNVVQVGKNNAIKGGVLLQDLSMAPQIVSGVFSVMSMVTGQYYMNQINNKLEKIEKSVEEVIKFLENDKRSGMESNEEYLRHVQNNYQSIIDNDDMRVATIATIQRIKIDSLSNVLFYKKQIGNLGYLNTKKDKADEINKNIYKTQMLVSEYWYSLYLYCFAAYLEPIIARDFDANHIQYILNDMKQKCERYKSDFGFWQETLKKYINNAEAYDPSIILSVLKDMDPIGIDPGVEAWTNMINFAAKIADKKDKKKKM